MSKHKAKERDPRSVAHLPLLPAAKPDEVPHWKVWRFTLKTGKPWWRS